MKKFQKNLKLQKKIIDLYNNIEIKIGSYINLKNNIVGTTDTKDDWRILYVDDNSTYAILTDYLPNSTRYAKNAGFIINNLYYVSSNGTSSVFVNNLLNINNWKGLTNGIDGATAYGAVTADVLNKSLKANGTTIRNTKDSLYFPRKDSNATFYEGYWLSNKGSAGGEYSAYCVCMCRDIYEIHDHYIRFNGFALRPIVVIPSNTFADVIDGVCEIKQE